MKKKIIIHSNSQSLYDLFKLLRFNINEQFDFKAGDIGSTYLVRILNNYKINKLSQIYKIFPKKKSKEILFNPLQEFLSSKEKSIIKKTFEEILISGQFTSGKYLDQIEEIIGKFVNQKYLVPTSSGTDAIILALISLGIKRNDKVIIPSNSFAATENAVFAIGAKPILFDINDNYCLDLSSRRLNKDIKAAIFVDLYGKNSLNKKIFEICKKNKIKIIQDSAQSFGLKNLGKYADAICLSFNPYKNFSACGKAGMVGFNKINEYKFAKRFHYHGFEIGKKDQKIIDYGLNIRMDNLQAAILVNKIQFFCYNNFKRLIIAYHYSDFFEKNNLKFVKSYPKLTSDNTWHQYPLQVNNPKDLNFFLKNKFNINNGKMYKYLTVDQKINYFKINKSRNKIPNTLRIHKKMINLPMHNGLSIIDVKSILEGFKKYQYGE